MAIHNHYYSNMADCCHLEYCKKKFLDSKGAQYQEKGSMVEFVVTQWYQHFLGQTFLIWLSYHYILIWLMAAILNF